MGIDARILVVDDSLVVQKLIELNIRHLGNIDLVTANDGMDGLRYLTEQEFDLAFVDINMPVMDGLTMLRLYREQDSGAQIPIVIVTTEGESETGGEAMQRGASAYITKPINAQTLRKVATELIEKHRAEKLDAAV